jgi:hypothetical protein
MYTTKIFRIPWYDWIDLLVISLSWTTIIYWIIIFIANDPISLPIEHNSDFQKFVDT